MGAPAHALLLDESPEFGSEVRAMLASRHIECTVATDGESCWRALAKARPDTILLTLTCPGVEQFYRHLRDEYMGARPRLFGVSDADDVPLSAAGLDLDGVLLRPVTSELLLGALAASPARNVANEVGRVREMLRLTSLGGEFQESLDSIAKRLTLVYGVSDCMILANASERQWVGSARTPVPQEEWPALWDRCDRAVNAGAPLFDKFDESDESDESDKSEDPGSPVETWLGAAIVAPGGAVVGAICLVARGALLYSGDSREALTDLAQRLGAEFAWRSVHDHVTTERDRLRENALLDPMLGIHTRAALEQALTTEVGRFHRNGEPLSVAVLDVAGLRVINDRYGHLAGDAALRHVADSARRLVRAQDVVGRYGGDEIALLMPSTSADGASAMLRRLCEAVESEPFETQDGTSVNVGIAIGITHYGGDDDDAGALLVRAAAAGYAAKRRGESIGVADTTTATGIQAEDTDLGVEAGLTLGGMYAVAHEISRGAMGVVYRAEDLGLSRPVAIKMLRPDLVTDQQLVVKFRQEAGILASLNHENLVRVYAFIEDKDDVFFVMELVEGVSLDDVISEYLEDESFLPASRVSAIINQIASALDAMHDANVMHRDVKPGNIVLDRARDRAVLVDVGLAQRFGTRGEPAGTPGFIAPESFRGGPETPATDVYGLAATTYTLLVGRAPFGRSDDYREILRRQLDERPPLPSSYRHDLSDDADLVILRGLAVSHSSRYSTAGEFARELADALGRAAARPDDGLRQDDRAATNLGAGTSRELTPPSVSAMARHTLPLDVELLPPAVASAATAPMTRGIIFRGAARVLGMANSTTWSRNIARTNRPLADALSLRTSQMAWLPADLFHDMIAAVAASGRNTERFTRELGTAVVLQTFRRFYPSSAESLSPGQTLSALEILWRRYHTWGRLDLKKLHEGYSTITYEGPGDPAMCAFVTGWLQGVVKMSGGNNPRCTHTTCTHTGSKRCDFSVKWTESADEAGDKPVTNDTTTGDATSS